MSDEVGTGERVSTGESVTAGEAPLPLAKPIPVESIPAEPDPGEPNPGQPISGDAIPGEAAATGASSEPEPEPAAASRIALGWIALLAWLVPGAGHLVLGRWARGLAFLAIVLAAIGIGVDLDGELWWFERTRPVTWLAAPACLGMGVPYGVLRWVAGYRGQLMAAGYEYGGAFLLTAGLMNLLLVLDALDVARGHKP
jgi:hypothetical protein